MPSRKVWALGGHEKGSQGVCACMYRCAHVIISLRVILGIQAYGIHRCLCTGSLCLPTGTCACFFFYWGEVELVLANLNWPGWKLQT